MRNRQGTRLPLAEPVAPTADVAAEQTTAQQTTGKSTTTSPTTSTTPRPLFATGHASGSAMRRLAQQFDLLGDAVETPLVA